MSSLIFLKYLNQTNSDIEDTKNVEVLSSINIYMLKFEHVYWANLIKMYIKKTELYLIKFINLYNDFEHLIKYLI